MISKPTQANKLRRVSQWLGPVALFVVGAVGTWIALSSPFSPASDSKQKETDRKPGSLSSGEQCLTDEAAVADLQKRRSELEAKEKEFEARLSELDVKDKAIQEQLKKIEAVRDDIKKTEELRSKEQGAKVGKVVDTFETMTPKSVSAMLSTMDEQLAVEAMNRMTTPKLAKILNLMEPAKSARLTERLVGMRPELQTKNSTSGMSPEVEKTSPMKNEEISERSPAADIKSE